MKDWGLCNHPRVIIDVYSTEYREICMVCGAYVAPPVLCSDKRACGCWADPAVFGHTREH